MTGSGRAEGPDGVGDDVVAALRAAGLDPGEPLGAGMEAEVVALRDGTVAKVWRSRTEAALRVEQAFYDAVAQARPSFAVPRVLAVRSLVVGAERRAVSVLPRLSGRPLWDRPGESPPLVGGNPPVLDAVVEVLAGLSALTVTPAMAALPVLAGEAPFDPAVSFGAQLAGLVERRVAAAGAVLVAAVPDVDDLAAVVVARLRSVVVDRPVLVHGDLVPANVLVGDGRVQAVLDMGYLTTIGDPVFDAAVTASITDMYGAAARDTEAALDARLGHPPALVATYRLAYAMITATWWSADGSDGHFAWCAAMLRRPDLRAQVARG